MLNQLPFTAVATGGIRPIAIPGWTRWEIVRRVVRNPNHAGLRVAARVDAAIEAHHRDGNIPLNSSSRIVSDVPVSEADAALLRETPDLHGGYPRLSESQVAALEAAGQRRKQDVGEVLFHEGDRTGYDFFVVLDGRVAILEGYGAPDERWIAIHGPGRFLGELSLLVGQPPFFSAVVQEPGEVLAVPVDQVRAIVAGDPALGDLILRAYLIRRSMLIELGVGLRIIGSRYSPDTRRLRDFAARNRLPHRWIHLEEDTSAEAMLQALGVAPEETPIVIWRGSEVMRNPSNAELAQAIGLRPQAVPDRILDVLVVGAGPAGLAASVYGASEGLATMTVDGVAPGGQAASSARIENYLGFPTGISGAELAERAEIQAGKFGATISVPATAMALTAEDGHYLARLDAGEAVTTRSVVIATGARYRKLDVPGFQKFEPASIYYAATQVEVQVCRGDPVAIVGGGNSAGQAALFVSRTATRVTMIVREPDLTTYMSRYLADRIEREPGIDVALHTEVRELLGDDVLEALVAEDNQTGQRRTIDARALFVFIGAAPRTGWLAGLVALDEGGFVVTGRRADDAALALETSRPGVFAAGDVRSGSIRRVASAVGEGAMAIRLVHEHLADQYGSRVGARRTAAGPARDA
jgi:thioredoxin reductase (NADPH)